MIWNIILWSCLGSGVITLILALALRFTLHSLDIYIHDRYFVVLPSQLLFIAGIFIIATLVVWKTKVVHLG
jgi:hypothetical protein